MRGARRTRFSARSGGCLPTVASSRGRRRHSISTPPSQRCAYSPDLKPQRVGGRRLFLPPSTAILSRAQVHAGRQAREGQYSDLPQIGMRLIKNRAPPRRPSISPRRQYARIRETPNSRPPSCRQYVCSMPGGFAAPQTDATLGQCAEPSAENPEELPDGVDHRLELAPLLRVGTRPC